MLRNRSDEDRQERVLHEVMLRWAHRGAVALLAGLVLAALLPVAAGAVEPEGAVYTWGDNGSGQLGRTATGQTAANPGAVNLDQVVQLAAGRVHSVAVKADGQTLHTWGGNIYGQLGNDSLLLQTSTPQTVAITDGGVRKTIKSIAAGSDHTLALTTDGQVWAWGNNASAQLAFDPNRIAFSRVPRKVNMTLPSGVTVTDIAAGDNFSLARSSDGAVYGWGDNARGQLGPGLLTGNETVKLTITPVAVGITGVTAIGAGANHSIAITAANTVLVWGDNDPVWRAVTLPAGAAAPVAVDGGRAHSLIRLADGRVATADPAAATPTAALVANLTGVTAVNARSDAAIAIANGAVYTWSASTLAAPAKANVSETAVAAAAGDTHNLTALAPKANINVSSITFDGITEVGATTPAQTITVANAGPGALRIGKVAFQEGQADYAFAAPNGDGCTNATVPANGACTIKVVFKPVAAGPRDSFLTIDHDAFGGDAVVELHGQAIVLSGNLSITTAVDHLSEGVPASPTAIALTDIPLQPQSPAIIDAQRAGELPLGDLIGIGELPLGDLIGIGELPLGDITGIGELPLGDLTGIGELPLGDLTLIGELPLGDLIGIGDPVRDFLGGITLSSLPLVAPHTWDDVLAGTALQGRPLQEVTLLDALGDAAAAARFRALPVRAVGWSASRLGGIGLLSFLIGNTPLSAISGHDWCAQLNAAGLANCGAGYGRKATPANGLSASPIEYDLAGVGLGRLNVAAVKLSQIGNANAPVFQLLLDRIDLYRSDLGSIPVNTLANKDAVVDCAKADCNAPTTTLASAQGARAVKATATLGHLGAAVSERSLGRLASGLLALDSDTYGAVPLDRMGIKGYAANDGRDTHKFAYQVSFANSSGNALPAGTTLTVKLPDSFVYVPGSSTMRVKDSAAAPLAVADPTAEGRTFTWTVPTSTLTVANGRTLLLDFMARPGLRLGTFTVSEVALSTPSKTIRSTAPSAPVRVVDGLEANDTPAAATPISEGELKVSHVSSSKDRDYFKFDAAGIAPGSRITVHLDHQQGGDADLLLYGAPGMKGEPVLRGTGQSTGAPVVPLKEALPPINGEGVSLQSDVQSDVHREASLPLLGMSQNRDARDETVVALALTPGAGGDVYLVEVAGYNGAFHDLPYSLRINIEPPAAPVVAPARTFPHAADPTFIATPQTTSQFTGATTLFLTAPGRLQRLYGTVAATQVATALKDSRLTQVIGKHGVLNVDSDPAVRAAYAAWDLNPADPLKANDVVRAINALADRLAPTASIQNVVVVGNDDVVPLARIADLTSTVSERLYAREAALRTTPANALVGAAAAGRFLSDDAYADVDPTPLPGAQFLYLSSAAIGRLVDTPAQITAVLNQFMQFGGVIDPKTALTTSGAPFLDDVATEIDKALGGKGVTRSSLTAQTWGKSELASAWNANPGIVAFNGHSDPSRTQARNGELFSTSDLAAANLARELVLTVGCHTGLPVADGVLRLPSQQSWASTLLGRGASGVAAQTGYGLGSKSTVALTEKVMLGFTKALGTSSVGQSLVTAKAQYVVEGGPADVLDAKALMQATFFGMPHLRFATPTPAPPAPPALTTGTDTVTGLPAAFLHRQSTNPSGPGAFAFQKHTTPDGTYYSIDGRTVSVAGRPVQPLLTQDVTRPGLRAHGIAFTGLTSTDADGTQFDPVLPRPVAAGIGSPEDELQAGDVAFPAALQAVRSVNGKDTAAVIPALFESTGVVNGKTVGLERRFTSLDATVLYAPADNTDFTPPTILSSRGVTNTTGDAVTFVVDAPEAVDVTVLLKEDGSSVWRQLRLARTATPGSTLFAGGTTVSGTRIEYFVQAVDASGNVAVMGNKGRLLVAEPIGSRVGLVIPTLTGVAAPSNPMLNPSGWFRTATVSFIVTDPSVIVSARVDGGPEEPATVIQFAGDGVANPPPGAVMGDGHHVVTYTASDGSTGVIVLRIDNAGPQITIANPNPDGSSFFVVGSSPKASYRCTDAASGVVPGSCTGTVPDGGTLPTNGGSHELVVNTSDLAGNSSTARVGYQAGYRFDGFLEPVQNRPTINTAWSAGQTVPMKWRLYDAANTPITATSTFVGAGSYEFACSGVPTPPPGPGAPTASQSGLSQTADGFQYGWSTQKAWGATCRRFVLRLDDGTFHLADFRFS